MNKIAKATQTIALDQATPGMILATEVRQKSGGVLLQSGITLTENHLASLLQRDVTEITIEAPQDASETSALSPEKRKALQKAIKQEVQHRFRRSGTDATTQALLRTVLEYRLEKLG